MARTSKNGPGAKAGVIKAAGYARISVAHEDSTSIEQQTDAIRRYCAANGWSYDPKKDLFVDEGFSGSKKNVFRPAFENLVKSVSSYDRIVVFRLDRLSRRTSELSKVLEDLHERNVFVVSTSEGLSTDTGHGLMTANILGSLAAGEAEAIRQRVSATQAKMFLEGKWKGGARPFGWTTEKLKGGGVRLVLVKEEARVLRKAINLIIKGTSIGATARKLNNDGERTYKGTPFSPQALSSMLRSEILIGQHVVNGRRSYGSDGKPLTPHEALITEDKWNELQLALARLRVVRPRKGGAVLVGVLRCWECGGKLTGSSTVNNPKANYRCRNRYALMNGKCKTGVSIKAIAVEELVSLAVLEVLKKKQSMRVASKRMRTDYDDYLKERKKAERSVEVARSVVLQLRDQNRRGVFSYSGGAEAFEEDFKLANEAVHEAERKLKDLGNVPEEPEDLRPWTSMVAIDSKWSDAPAEEKNSVIRALIDHIVVQPRSTSWKHRGLDPSRISIVWNIAESKGK